MRRTRVSVGILVAVLSLAIASVAAAAPGQGGDHRSEQIVFSGTGFGDFGPFGFWIWCQDPDSSTTYAEECAGAIYFYALHITKGVEGDVEDLTADRGLEIRDRVVLGTDGRLAEGLEAREVLEGGTPDPPRHATTAAYASRIVR